MSHSKYYAPSSFMRRRLCPASANMENLALQQFGDSSSPAAQEGTACHLIMYDHFVNKKRLKGFIGETIEETYIIEDHVELCKTAAENVRRLTRKYKFAEPEFEKKVNMDRFGIADMHGTADLVIDQLFDKLVILDHKFGQGAVSPDSDQLKCYAIMAAGDEAAIKTYQEFHLYISQPKRPNGDGETLHCHVMTPDELLAYLQEVIYPTVATIQRGDQIFNATEEGCQWCKARTFCPEYSKFNLELAKIEFRQEITAPSLTPEMVQKVFPHLKLFENWIADVKDKALELAQEGRFPGYKVVAGNKRRSWLDPVAAEEIIKASGHDPFTHKLLSPAQAEKLKGPAIKSKIKGLIDAVPGGPKVVPESDKRKAIVASATDDFKNVNTEKTK